MILHLACRVSPRVRATEGPDGFVAACHFWASKGAAGSQQPAIGEGMSVLVFS